MTDKKWGAIHHQLYPHVPFSSNSFLALIFERSSSSGGSRNTVNVAPPFYYEYAETKRLDSKHSANFKMILDGQNGYYSTDTGVSGNVLSKHYFDMNERHLAGDLLPILLNREEHIRLGNSVLELF